MRSLKIIGKRKKVNKEELEKGRGSSYTEKKKIEFSSYIRKFRMEQFQSHI